jgi:hypothetical protein
VKKKDVILAGQKSPEQSVVISFPIINRRTN